MAVWQRDGGFTPVDDDAVALLDDDTWFQCKRLLKAECVRRWLDGGVVANENVYSVRQATLSGWLLGEDIGTSQDT